MSTGEARAVPRRILWAAFVGGIVMRLLASTWRMRQVNRSPMESIRQCGRPVILALWHGEMLPLLWHHRREDISILISEHADGEIIARVAHSLGYPTVRGSTSRGAGRALLGLCRVVESGRDVAITPDGPRGPTHQFAPGALVVAQRTGAPIIPLRVFAPRAWRLRSWDRFLIPRPFSRITVSYGNPVYVTAATPRAAVDEAERLAMLMGDAAAAARA
ncbi:MAG TPA: lysophospholipid acyltransferase family protein [Gemmatimonadaceae bacterium]|nr:lysophospholipid acyltransferase family protein [Gemmatimonadaceae bacterium]